MSSPPTPGTQGCRGTAAGSSWCRLRAASNSGHLIEGSFMCQTHRRHLQNNPTGQELFSRRVHRGQRAEATTNVMQADVALSLPVGCRPRASKPTRLLSKVITAGTLVSQAPEEARELLLPTQEGYRPSKLRRPSPPHQGWQRGSGEPPHPPALAPQLPGDRH